MIIVKVGDEIHIKAEYSNLAIIREKVRGAKWSPGPKAWVAKATPATFLNLLEAAPSTFKPAMLNKDTREWYSLMALKVTRMRGLQSGQCDAPVFPEWFKFVGNPYKHQQEALAFILNIPRAALWLDLGLGKTYISIHAARYRYLRNEVVKVLVLAPVSVAKQWPEEVDKFGGGAESVVIKGSPKAKKKLLQSVRDVNKLTFAIMSYESVPNLSNEIINAGFDMIIMDESTKIKNPTAVRTKPVIDVAHHIPYALELTGLAYLNNPLDLFSQYFALDPTVFGYSSHSFENRYVRFVSTPFGNIPAGIKRLPELKSRAYYLAFSRDKNECVDLPEKTYLTTTVKMTDEQTDIYNSVCDELEGIIEAGEKEVTIRGALPQIAKLQQITSGFIIADDGSVKEFSSPKYAEMLSVIESSNDNFIIWCRHRHTVQKAVKTLTEANIACKEMTNRIPDEERQASIASFRSGEGVRVLVCSLASESRGLNFTSAKSVSSIYLENSMSVDERWQSESRQHRIGMNGTATYVDIVAEGTIDEEITSLLKSKYKISEYIAKYGLKTLLGAGHANKKLKRRKVI